MHAKVREANRRHSCARSDIQQTQVVFDLRRRKNILQVVERQVGAQPAFGRIKVGGVILCAIKKSFVRGHRHLYSRLISSDIQAMPSPIQSTAGRWHYIGRYPQQGYSNHSANGMQ
jgi:hypothetical protein